MPPLPKRRLSRGVKLGLAQACPCSAWEGFPSVAGRSRRVRSASGTVSNNKTVKKLVACVGREQAWSTNIGVALGYFRVSNCFLSATTETGLAWHFQCRKDTAILLFCHRY